MDSLATQKLRHLILKIIEEAEKQCTDLMLGAVRAKSHEGMELAGEMTIKLREIIEVLQQPTTGENEETLVFGGARSVTTKRKGSKSEYPKFHIENGCLVKVGWSKKAKKEYIHKLPGEVFQELLEIIARRTAASVEHFPAMEILEATKQLPEPVPDYQVYLALAFLQDRGILEKNGRRGFLARQAVREAGIAVWESLAAD